MNGVGKEIKCQSDFELFCLRDVNFPLQNYKSVKNRESMLFFQWTNVIPKSLKLNQVARKRLYQYFINWNCSQFQRIKHIEKYVLHS